MRIDNHDFRKNARSLSLSERRPTDRILGLGPLRRGIGKAALTDAELVFHALCRTKNVRLLLPEFLGPRAHVGRASTVSGPPLRKPTHKDRRSFVYAGP